MNKKIKVGVIGCGAISQAHYNGYSGVGGAEVWALADPNPEALVHRGDAWGVPPERRFTDHGELLKLPEVEAVSICTPNLLHCRQSIDALRAGKHVLCEKPMAMNPTEAKRMLDAAEKAGKVLQIGLHHRFRSDARFIKRLVEEGQLGEIYYARCQAVRRRGTPSWGMFGRMDMQGGGALIDIGVHQIDLTWWLMGCPTPVSVTGRTYRTIGAEPGHVGIWGPWDHSTYTVEDFASGFVRFENGATMTVECSFNVNLDSDREGCNLAGTKGGAGLSPFSLQTVVNGHITDCTPNHIGAGLNNPSPHDNEIAAFCRSVRGGERCEAPGAEAIWTQKIIDGLYRSSKTGKEVQLS